MSVRNTTAFRTILDGHLQAYEFDQQDCLSTEADATCFPRKTTPGLAVDYENRSARVENLSRQEGEAYLTYFANQAEKIKIDKEEAWVYFEMVRSGERKSLWIEIGKDEDAEGVRADGIKMSEAKQFLEEKGWVVSAMSLYHIHQRSHHPDALIFGFSMVDLDYVALLLPPRIEQATYSIDQRIATPVGVYVLKPNERNQEDREHYFQRFQNGVEWFAQEEKTVRDRCCSPGRDFVEASGCFAIGTDTLLAAHAWPVSISFITAPDR